MTAETNRLRQLWRWPPTDLTLLASILCAAIGLLLFLLIADAVMEGETRNLDEAILLALRQTGDAARPIGPAWLSLAMRDITSLGGMTLLTLITASVLAYLLLIGDRRTALLIFVAVAGGVVMSTGLKNLFGRPRPDLVAHLVNVETLSFPSGHATLSAVTYLTLGALLARTQPRRALKVYFIALAAMLTMLIGFSRVYLGVHWPSDVVAGWAIGTAWALLWRIIDTALLDQARFKPQG